MTAILAVCQLSGMVAAGAQQISGAGSTFVAPAMAHWIGAYKKVKPEVAITYQAVGSGKGIDMYRTGTVDFGATDAPLSDTELSQMPPGTAHVPVAAGPIVVVFNMPGFPADFRMSGETIAQIFLGKISMWDDPRIQRENPSIKLPPTRITPVHRSDSSGTTFIFTDFLSTVSPDWRSGPGKGKVVRWPVGSGLPGNGGVAERVYHTAGSIGYIELAYALPRNMRFVQVQNAAGQYVRASVESTEAGANAAVGAMKGDVRVSLVDTRARDAYPIIGFTYLLVSTRAQNPQRGAALDEFVKWILGPGQPLVQPLRYAPVPPAIASIAVARLGQTSAR